MNMDSTNTEKVGAEPAKEVEEKDVNLDSSPKENDGKQDSSPEQPWHKDPRFKNELNLIKSAKRLMESNGLESIDELAELVENGLKVRGKEADIANLDQIKSKAKKLEEYQAYWKDQEERKKREQEFPEQTIARLQNELKKEEERRKREDQERQEQEMARNAIRSFEREVSLFVKDTELPREQQALAMKFYGVGNVFNDVDILDKKAVKKMLVDGMKDLENFKQSVIKEYLEKKGEVPKVAAAISSAPTQPVGKMKLPEAHKAFREIFKGVIK